MLNYLLRPLDSPAANPARLTGGRYYGTPAAAKCRQELIDPGKTETLEKYIPVPQRAGTQFRYRIILGNRPSYFHDMDMSQRRALHGPGKMLGFIFPDIILFIPGIPGAV
jgi:hypothetical protein